MADISQHEKPAIPDKPQPPRRRRRWLLRIPLFGIAVLSGLVFFGPWVVSLTPLRHKVVGAVVGDDNLDTTVDQLQCGWLARLRLSGLHIAGTNEQLRVDVQELRFDKSWLFILLKLPHIGSLHCERPKIEVTLSPKTLAIETAPGKESAGKPPAPITLSATVNDAALCIRTPQKVEPVIAFDALDLAFSIAPGPNGRRLTVQPFQVFSGEAMTSALCDSGLQLVAPVLSDSVNVEGQVSLSLTEVELPLDIQDPDLRMQQTTLSGRLRLDQVKTGLKNPLLLKVAELASSVLKMDVPQIVEIADDTEVAFELRDGKVYHEGLVFWLPELSEEIQWQTSGTVGLDESLDLKVQARLPLTLIHNGPLARRLSKQPFSLHVTGTLDKPEVALFQEGDWLKGLLDLVTSTPPSGDPSETAEKEDPLAATVGAAVGRALEGLTDPDRPTPFLDRLKKQRETNQEKKADEPEAESTEEPETPRRGILRDWIFRRRNAKERDDR